MDDAHRRRRYIALALVFGLPGLAGGGIFAVLGVWVGMTASGYFGAGTKALFATWGLAGCLGLLAWLWLSAVYLRHGGDGLRRSGCWPWAGLALGALAALPMLVLGVWHATGGNTEGWAMLLLGPPLLVPAWALLRRRSG